MSSAKDNSDLDQRKSIRSNTSARYSPSLARSRTLPGRIWRAQAPMGQWLVCEAPSREMVAAYATEQDGASKY